MTVVSTIDDIYYYALVSLRSDNYYSLIYKYIHTLTHTQSYSIIITASLFALRAYSSICI